MRLTCPAGHRWESADSTVCPTCGLTGSTAAERAAAQRAERAATREGDAEQTLDMSASMPAEMRAAISAGFSADMSAGKPAGKPADISADITLSPETTIDLPTPARGAAAMDASEMTQTLSAPAPARPSTAAGTASNALPRASSTRGSTAATTSGVPFAIIREHAKGGLGVVQLARDNFINREVALKQILPQHVDNAVLQRRFLYEAQITGQLEHPSIVPVYCLGTDSANYPYYVMRFVKGRTLDEIIREHHVAPNPIVFRELLRRFIAVCQAVAYAHSRGIIHRDLKPANVMLGDYGETLVLDWGLAKDIKQGGQDPALWSAGTGTAKAETAKPKTDFGTGSGAPSAELTMQGQIIGTPAYMAPEQAEGKTELHAPVTDIYALGGILYKILTGKSPQAPTSSFTGPAGQRVFTFVPSPPPSQANPATDPTLERICMRCMNSEPAARYPRALELAQEIQRWLDENPLTMRPRNTTGHLRALIQTHAVAIVAFLAVLLVVAMFFAFRRH
jgi:serine/threonine protein kinase